ASTMVSTQPLNPSTHIVPIFGSAMALYKNGAEPFRRALPQSYFTYYPPSFGSSAVTPSAHQYMPVLQGTSPPAKQSISICSSFSPAASTSLPWLSLIGPANTSKRSNSPASILARVSFTN